MIDLVFQLRLFSSSVFLPLVPRHRPGDVNHTGELAIQLDEPPARGRPVRSVESSL